MPKPTRQPETRLGHDLRVLASRPEYADRAQQLQIAARNLDVAAIQLAARGEKVKQLASYRMAASLYQRVTGQPYATK